MFEKTWKYSIPTIAQLVEHGTVVSKLSCGRRFNSVSSDTFFASQYIFTSCPVESHPKISHDWKLQKTPIKRMKKHLNEKQFANHYCEWKMKQVRKRIVPIEYVPQHAQEEIKLVQQTGKNQELHLDEQTCLNVETDPGQDILPLEPFSFCAMLQTQIIPLSPESLPAMEAVGMQPPFTNKLEQEEPFSLWDWSDVPTFKIPDTILDFNGNKIDF